MRKDKGLNGDLDRLPMLTWLLFLKFLDDLETVRETEAHLEGRSFEPAIAPPYRWRDWAAPADGITGDALIAFINQEESALPYGTRGPGLFAYLRNLSGRTGTDRRDVIRAVFSGTTSRMLSGYLLRDLINRVNEVQFTSSEEVSTLGLLYESMLREMRDAAGDSGEFYTPRPLVRFIVQVMNPRLGETVLDPACGTGGFLTEAFEHLRSQCRTTEDHRILQEASVVGVEAKPLPFLLCQMNLLLHGMEAPRVDPSNALRHRLTEIGDADRVDVILTNPPFGGEEQRGILSNFPADKQTSETALLFLQLIMKRLRRGTHPGRAAVVVPDGVLAGDGVSARIKEELLTEYNLHTIVRLGPGVFAPYTGIPANILFFDRTESDGRVWYYEVPVSEGRKTYTKTRPLKFEELEDCISWWTHRTEGTHAWRVPVAELLASGCNLDIKNPAGLDHDYDRPISTLAAELSVDLDSWTKGAAQILDASRWRVFEEAHEGSWRTVTLGDVLAPAGTPVAIEPDASYGLVGVRLSGAGPFLRETKRGAEISAQKLNRLSSGWFIYSRLFAWRGAFGLVPEGLDGCYASNEFPTYTVQSDVIRPDFLRLYFARPLVWAAVEKKCQGTTKASRNRFKEVFLMQMQITIPPVSLQDELIGSLEVLSSVHRDLQVIEQRLSHFAGYGMSALYRSNL